MKKYGLRSQHAAQAAARGGVDRERLEELVRRNLPLRKIAAEVGLSVTAVRHWLQSYGLETETMRRRRLLREGRATGAVLVTAPCSRHGDTEFHLRNDGAAYRCMRCRSDDVSTHRRRMRAELVAGAGGCCTLCGYNRCIAALQFHHVDRL